MANMMIDLGLESRVDSLLIMPGITRTVLKRGPSPHFALPSQKPISPSFRIKESKEKEREPHLSPTRNTTLPRLSLRCLPFSHLTRNSSSPQPPQHLPIPPRITIRTLPLQRFQLLLRDPGDDASAVLPDLAGLAADHAGAVVVLDAAGAADEVLLLLGRLFGV